MMFEIIYVIMWIVATTIFVWRWKREWNRVDAFVLTTGIFTGFFWFAYFSLLVILRLINGDWRS